MATGLLKAYLEEVRLTRQFGVAETSFYPALKTLFETIGGELKPKVILILHPRSQGAGIPDGGLFLASRARREVQMDIFKEDNVLPDRGAVEVKPPTENVEDIAKSPQGQKYVAKYGHLLVTNLRHFALYRRTPNGPEKIDEVILASSDAKFKELLNSAGNPDIKLETALREFLLRACLAGVPLDKPETVASFIASYAREALRRAENAPDTAALDAVRKALQDALGITFDAEQGRHFFLSTLVQTLFYGVFSGWVLWHEQNPRTTEKFRRGDTVDYLRVPMVDLLFQNLAGPKTLEPLGLKELLDQAVEVLNRVDRDLFFEAFDERDAVQYFYEPFLAAFDPVLRKELGVWYTPKEIVRYQVRRVDQLLRNELGLKDGLADDNVVVLDPCCGTGTYLVEVMALIEQRLTDRFGPTLAPEKVKQAALRRIFGFELIPAPYVVAHLQLGLLLNRKHAPLANDERFQVYLTNALTGWDPKEDAKKQLDLYGLQEEREAALKVKRQAPILVILGNPPYNGFAGITESSEERALSDSYRKVKEAPEPQGQGLNDLYVRFYRMAERRIVEGKLGQGVISFISNYSWLDSLSCPGMRERFLDAFDGIWVDNLHGDRIISENAPDGKSSQTVFAVSGQSVGIKPGTAIATCVRRTGAKVNNQATVRYRGHQAADAAERRRALLETTDDESCSEGYEILSPSRHLGFPFKPRAVSAAYLNWPNLPELLPASFPGVKTARDGFLVAEDLDVLETRRDHYLGSGFSDRELFMRYPVIGEHARGYDPVETREEIRKSGSNPFSVLRYEYRPFDRRHLLWEGKTKLLDEKREDYVLRVQSPVPQLVCAQRTRRGFDPPLVIKDVGSYHLVESVSHLFPAWIERREEGHQGSLFGNGKQLGTQTNVDERVQNVCDTLGFTDQLVPFYHAVATMHSSAYRDSNSGALRQDWPRVPWPKNVDEIPADREALRQALEHSAALGRRVAALLDSETPVEGVTTGRLDPTLRGLAEYRRLDGQTGGPVDKRLQARWGYRGQGGVVMPATGRITEDGDRLTIHANDSMGWHNVPRAVWEYKLGGYQVLKKWLSYRELEVLGRDLTVDEILHLTQTARRIAALLAMGPELDATHAAVCVALG
ncbi:MAG: type ISP restriction/modification enzyme [Fimbriimonas sp.]